MSRALPTFILPPGFLTTTGRHRHTKLFPQHAAHQAAQLCRCPSVPRACVNSDPPSSAPPPPPSQPPPPKTEEDHFRDFLTQRAVQQTIYCAFELRDETTARWLEAFAGHIGLSDLHACNALQLRSTDYLRRLLRAPPETIVVHKPIPGRTLRPNPYLTKRYFTYEVDLIPKRIALRVLAARGQIATELVEDLACLPAENVRVRARSAPLPPDHDAERDAPRDGDGDGDAEADTDSDVAADDNVVARNAEKRRREKSEASRREQYFADALEIALPTAVDRGGSPYRAANYDLVKNYTLYLATRSLHAQRERKLRLRTSRGAAGASSSGSGSGRAGGDAQLQKKPLHELRRETAWLSALADRVGGDLLRPYGGAREVADDVLADLLNYAPVVADDGTSWHVSPLVNELLEERLRCGERWVDLLNAVPDEQLQLERDALEDGLWAK